MLTLRRSDERGHLNHGWLDTFHTFSFNTYFDPFMGYRGLRVINEDRIAPGAGFGTHPHRDMEIVTWVLEGGLAHKDSTGAGGIIRPGEAQHMSAGSGVRHSEFNASGADPVHLLQIWVEPSAEGIDPTYSQKSFPIAAEHNRMHPIASPKGEEESLKWTADAVLFAARLDPGAQLDHVLSHYPHGWLQVARGSVEAGEHALGQGDGAALSEEKSLHLIAGAQGAEILLFELA